MSYRQLLKAEYNLVLLDHPADLPQRAWNIGAAKAPLRQKAKLDGLFSSSPKHPAQYLTVMKLCTNSTEVTADLQTRDVCTLADHPDSDNPLTHPSAEVIDDSLCSWGLGCDHLTFFTLDLSTAAI